MTNNEKIPLERFRASHSASSITPSPKGENIAVSVDISGQRNLWLFNLSGQWRRLTPFTDRRATPCAWDSKGKRLLFMSDYQGNEKWDIYLWEREQQWYRKLVDGPDVTHFVSDYPWSPRERKIVFTANRDERRRFDVYSYNVATGKVERLHKGPIGMMVFAYWHKASNQIIIQNVVDPDTMELYVVDNGEMEKILGSEQEIYQFEEPYQKGFFLETNHRREFNTLAYYDFTKGEYEIMGDYDWNVTGLAVGNNYLVYKVNEDGYSRLYMRNLQSGKTKEVSKVNGAIWSLKHLNRGDKFIGLFSRYHHPLEVYTLDLTDTRSLKRKTNLFYGRIPKEKLISPEVIRYESFDGANIPTLIWKPKKAGASPVVLYPHGGPEAQSRPTYGPLLQYLLHWGIGIAKPNYRGSSGYGKTYRRKIRGKWGEGELKDIKYCVNYLKEQEWADEERIGIFGLSYGGFLTLSSITRLPEVEWKVAVDLFGPSNLITFIQHAPPYWQAMVKRLVGDPSQEEVRQQLKEKSPITHIDNIECPLMVVQGANDIRVKKSESDQIVEKLKKKDLPVKYIVFEDEGHGFSKEKNHAKAIREASKFILEHIE